MNNTPTLVSQTLYFDLSFTADPTATFQLKAFKSTVNLTPLTGSSLSSAIDKLPALGLLPSTNLTHSATVDLPQDWVHMIRVYGPSVELSGTGTDSGSSYDVPTMVLKAIHFQSSGDSYTKSFQKNKLKNLYLINDFKGISDADIEKDLSNFYGPYDLAAALIYNHPEMMNYKVHHAMTIHDALSSNSNLYSLSYNISIRALVEPPGTWNQPVIQKDDVGNTLKFPSSNRPVYTYEMASWVFEDLITPTRKALQITKNHPDLKGVCWHSWPGVHQVKMEHEKYKKPSGLGTPGSPFISKLVNESPIHGLKMNVTNATTSELDVELVNSFVRYLSFYVRFLGTDGKPIDLFGQEFDDFLDSFINKDFSGVANVIKSWLSLSTTDQYVGMVPNENDFMGIPVHAQHKKFTIPFPKKDGVQVPVSGIELLCGGLGEMSGIAAADRGSAWLGLGYTAFFDLALPTYSLLSTAGSSGTSIVEAIFKDKKFIAKVAYNIYEIIDEAIKGDPNFLNDLASILIGLTQDIVRKVLMDPDVWVKLAAYFGAEEAEEAIPVSGDIMKVALCAASAAQLLQTTTEVLCSPMVMKGKITYSMGIDVTLTPISEARFPSTANTCDITFIYSDGTSHVTSVTLTADSPQPFSVTTYELPVGGKVKVQVNIYSDDNDVVGQGASGWYKNVPDGTNPLLSIPVNIEENLHTLDSNTTYSPHNKMTYQSDAYQWKIDYTEPGATVENLQRTGLEELFKITLNQDWGTLGYAWKTDGNYYLQNVGMPPNPNFNLQVLSQSDEGKILPAYLRSIRNMGTDGKPAPPDPQGNHDSFLLDPNFTEQSFKASGYYVPPADKLYHLRKVTLVYNSQQTDGSNPPVINFDNNESWGCFPSLLDDLAVHINGYVVGVNEEYNQLLLLKLPDNATSNQDAPRALPCSGKGTRPGLVNGPVKVAMANDGRVLVLEKGGAAKNIYPQVQSFDVHLNPVDSFYPDKKAQNFFKLDMPNGIDLGEVTYLSMSVEFTGHIYILWYEDDGHTKEKFHLDIYTPKGKPLTKIKGFVAANMVVGLWRNVFTLNYESQQGYEGRMEPTINEWVPVEGKSGD